MTIEQKIFIKAIPPQEKGKLKVVSQKERQIEWNNISHFFFQNRFNDVSIGLDSENIRGRYWPFQKKFKNSKTRVKEGRVKEERIEEEEERILAIMADMMDVDERAETKRRKRGKMEEEDDVMMGGKREATAPSRDSIWVEKYRPQSLSDVIAHEHIMLSLTKFYSFFFLFFSSLSDSSGERNWLLKFIWNSLIEEHKLPHMLFYGPPGFPFNFFIFVFVWFKILSKNKNRDWENFNNLSWFLSFLLYFFLWIFLMKNF